ncbi:MAG: tRNA (guanine(10)-N(2))-dimethyltransferase [Methanobacterium sp.]|nr:tRNA (guanine(10)-N(2))-dimethyltransferase [Methanobacterium sp.]
MDSKIIYEGKVIIKVPKFEKITAKAPVFYNPAMELNRDLSVAAISAFKELVDHDISVCDIFTGTGIRGIRYAKEIDGVQKAVINDLNPLAVELSKENITLNKLDNVMVCKEDANIILRKCKGKFDVIDIDPFGTPSYFVESAAASLKSEGMICITATDTSALCGTYTEPCVRKYGAVPLKTEYCHENGLRILVGFIARIFAKYKKYIEVKFSHSTEHYMRIYAVIGKGAANTDESLKSLGYIAHCKNCLNRIVFKDLTPIIPGKCPVCGGIFKVGGPLWCGEMYDQDFICLMKDIITKLTLNKEDSANKLLDICIKEANAPVTYFEIHKVCKNLKTSAPPLIDIIDLLIKEGFFVSRTHFSPTSLKTNANIDELKNIIIDLKQLLN